MGPDYHDTARHFVAAILLRRLRRTAINFDGLNVQGLCHQHVQHLLAALRRPVFRTGRWQQLECVAAWDGNWTSDCFVACAWEGDDGERRVIVVNYAENQSQCYVRIPFEDMTGSTVQFADVLRSERYERDGTAIAAEGLYVDLPAWGYHVFEL